MYYILELYNHGFSDTRNHEKKYPMISQLVHQILKALNVLLSTCIEN